MTANTETAILERLIDPKEDDLSRDAAQSLLRLDFKPQDVERMNELAALARDGALTADQKAELENYLKVGHLLALIHSKARLSLNRSNAA
jgi:hypothetical protein